MTIDPDNPLAVEIRQEMASAYFAACRKMVDALEALKTFDRSTTSATLEKNQVARRADLLEAARERVHYLVIQREAMQLACYEHFFETYEIPDEVRMHLGPKRQRL